MTDALVEDGGCVSASAARARAPLGDLCAAAVRRTLAPVVVLVAALFAVGAGAGAQPAVSGNPCAFLSAKQLATIHVPAGSCKYVNRSSSLQGPSTEVTWGKVEYARPSVTAMINVPSAAEIPLIRPTYDKTGASVGVGAWSRSGGLTDGTSDTIVFEVGKYLVTVQFFLLTTHPLGSPAPLIAMTKSLAARL